MDFTRLPFEVQFEYLLPLSYDQIVNYCQVNQTAAKICQSELFWNIKAEQEFGLPLGTIYAEAPAQQYKILSKIYNPESENFQEKVLFYNQPHLLLINDWKSYSLLDNIPENIIVEELEQGNNTRLEYILHALSNDIQKNRQ
jgi:hypothetical protein